MSKFDDTPRRRKVRERKLLTKKDLGIDTSEGRFALRATIRWKNRRAYKGKSSWRITKNELQRFKS